MGALLDRYRGAGVAFVALSDGSLRALGPLTEPIRATIRTEKAAILAELAANDGATPVQVAAPHRLVPEVCRLVVADDADGCLAAALADPHDNGMRTCRGCANLSPAGRCLAALRRESFGPGMAVARNYRPMPDVPQRCGPYAPRPGDPDRRSGRERWPFLYDVPSRRNGGPRG